MGIGWWLLNSLWLLIPIAGFGCLSGLPMIVIGLVAKRRAWWIAGIAYTVVAWTAFIGFGLLSEADRKSAVANILLAVVMLNWLACIVHSVVVDVHWLQSRAGRAWSAPTGVPAPTPQPLASTGSGLPPGLVPPPSTYYASAQPSPVSSGLLDLNSVTVDQLAQLPGMNRRTAERVIEARESRGGFRAVTDLAALGELDPHEFARIRERLTCHPRPQPDRNPSPYGGRIVDV